MNMDRYSIICLLAGIGLLVWAYNGLVSTYPIISVFVLILAVATFIYLTFTGKVE